MLEKDWMKNYWIGECIGCLDVYNEKSGMAEPDQLTIPAHR